MDDTLKMTDTYWEILKSLSDDIKLHLAIRLTVSVVVGKVTHKDRTQNMTERHMDKWKDERSTEKIIKDMYEGRKSIKAPLNLD